MDLSKLYSNRFNEKEIEFKDKMWKILCKDFFQQFIDYNDTVLDTGGGYCEFINNIKCSKKIVVDLNEDIKNYASSDVEVYNKSVIDLDFLENNSVDKVFISNFLEHIDKNSISVLLKNINIKISYGGGYFDNGAEY